jgi:hypothetical protein
MVDVERRVSGDWIDIRELGKDTFALKDYFKIPEQDLKIQLEKLQFSVEQGIVEYKRASLGPLFRMLDSSRYQNPEQEIIVKQVQYSQALLYIVLLQRLIAEGSLKLSHAKIKDEGISTADLNLKDIIEDVNKRIKENPNTAKHPSIKKILMQVGIYKKEQETMKKLLPTIKEDNKESFMKNFRNTFAEIIEKIKRNYLDILMEENPPDTESRNVLAHVPLGELLPVLTPQCQKISKIRSTLLYVKEEKYQTRDILQGLRKEQEPTMSLFEKEMQMYQAFGSKLDEQTIGDRAIIISRAMCHELIQVVEKELAFRHIPGQGPE